MRHPAKRGASSLLLFFLTIHLSLMCSTMAIGQDSAPLPPPMPHMGSTDNRSPTTGPVMSDPSGDPAALAAPGPAIGPQFDSGKPELIPSPTGQAAPEIIPTPAPLAVERDALGSFNEYVQRQQNREIQRLTALRMKIDELAHVIREYKRSEQAAKASAERAKKREIAALATAREAAKREFDLDEKQRELMELMNELERREQRLRSQQLRLEKDRERQLGDPDAPIDQDMATPPAAPTTATPVTIAPPEDAPSTVTSGAVDKRGLADNLFGAGEYKLAADVYQELLGESNDRKETIWFRFQVGNCFRHLGNEELAASYYREVAADQTDSFLADTARWWLNGMEHRSTTRSKVAELETILEQATNAIDEAFK